MWHSISDGQPTDRAIAVLLAALLGIVLSALPAGAQQWGRDPPVWGQFSAPTWGQYQGRIGANGWQYNKSSQPYVPQGAILNPNQTSGGPGTGALFTTPDTRLLGRNAP